METELTSAIAAVAPARRNQTAVLALQQAACNASSLINCGQKKGRARPGGMSQCEPP